MMEAIQKSKRRKIFLTLTIILLLLAITLTVITVCFWDDLVFWWRYDVRYDEMGERFAFFGVKNVDTETLVLPNQTPDGHEIKDIIWLSTSDSGSYKDVKTIVIPDSYRYGNLDFEKFPNLERLVIGENFDVFGELFISVPLDLQIDIDSDNPLYRAEGGSVLSKDGKVLLVGSGTGIIPASVEQIYDAAFAFNSHIRTVIIPNGVKRVGMSSFALCDSLTAVYVSASVTEFVGDPFDSSKLTVVFESETLPCDTTTGATWQPKEGQNLITGMTREEFNALYCAAP